MVHDIISSKAIFNNYYFNVVSNNYRIAQTINGKSQTSYITTIIANQNKSCDVPGLKQVKRTINKTTIINTITVIKQ
jgi:hypothetical protein